MGAVQHLITGEGRRIAYHRQAGRGPGVVFLGGFRSDMGGTKAMFLQDWAEATGRAYLRFDYSGHGQSSGAFADGCIGDWAADAAAVLSGLTEGPQVLVGSSMGGWIALLLARQSPERIAALVGIAAAPDFTEDSIWAGLSNPARRALLAQGQLAVPAGGAEPPYLITRRLIEDGRRHLVLRAPLTLPFPVRLLQGSADTDVPIAVALRLLEHARGGDIRLQVVKGADHRFSAPECLGLLRRAVEEAVEGGEDAAVR